MCVGRLCYAQNWFQHDYRRLGRSGLKISELAVGSGWHTSQVEREPPGVEWPRYVPVNLFDNARFTQAAKAKKNGSGVERLGWPRLSTSYRPSFFGMPPGKGEFPKDAHIESQILRQRRRLAERRSSTVSIGSSAIGRSESAVEETVWAMHEMVERARPVLGHQRVDCRRDSRRVGRSRSAHLHKPVMEQPQYNLLHRKRVEQEYKRLYEDIGLGLTTWSPLASGLLSGKYRKGVPPGSRGALEGYAFLREGLTDPAKNDIVTQLESVARDLSCTLAQLSLAWCLTNRSVSTVITGATRVEQGPGKHEGARSLAPADADAFEPDRRIVGGRT